MQGVYSVVVALRRLFRISLDHAAATKQMLLDGGLLILVLDTVVNLILSDENNRKCFSPRRQTTEATEKLDLERSASHLKTDLEEDAIDLQCVQACADVENLLQKFVLDSGTAKRHVRDKSIWPDFRPMLVREGILLLQEFASGNYTTEEEQPSSAKQPSSKPAADTVESTAAAVLNQLLTPPIAQLLVDDPRTFIDVIASERVRRPIAYWDASMLQTLQQVTGEELHRIHSAFGLDTWPVWTAQVSQLCQVLFGRLMGLRVVTVACCSLSRIFWFAKDTKRFTPKLPRRCWWTTSSWHHSPIQPTSPTSVVDQSENLCTRYRPRFKAASVS